MLYLGLFQQGLAYWILHNLAMGPSTLPSEQPLHELVTHAL
jgi:hypothetical protein